MGLANNSICLSLRNVSLPKLLMISFTEKSIPYRILLLPVCSEMSTWVMQSLGPDSKNNSSSRFQISVTAVILPGRNWTIETHSFNCFACRSSNQMFCQNFCGPFPISLLRMCLVCLSVMLVFSFLLIS